MADKAETVDGGIEQIRQDLACPDCQYNLRGLIGAVVSCPECGMAVDVALLVTHQWTRPWYSAPGYNRLAYPFIIAVIGAVSAIFIGASFDSGYVFGWLAAIALFAALAVTIWITREDGYEACIHCLLLIPLVIVGYLGSIFVFIGGVVGLIGYIVSLQVPSIFFSGLITVVAAGGVWVSRKVDRYIAGRCIARYLARRSVD